MTKKGNLFLLIKSLSKTEKRYFKVYAGLTGRNVNYLKLFDIVDKQKEYDEAEVRRNLKGEKLLSQLHVAKIYLTDLILKALKNYHADTSVQFTVLDLLKEVELLFDKELYELCHYKIQKAEDLATKYEKLSLLIEVYFWKRKLALAISSSQQDVQSVLAQEGHVIEQMKVLNTYWRHTVNLSSLINDGDALKALTSKKPDDTYALQSRILHFHILYGLAFINRDVKGANKHISDLIKFLENYPDRIKEDPHSYVTAISNKIGLCLAGKMRDEVPALIQKIREVPEKYKLENESKFTVRLWLRTFNVELEMYRDSRQLDKALVLMEEIQRFIETRRKAIPDDYILLLYYQFANIFFLKKEYSKSLRWLNEIINSNFGDTKEDIQSYARILNLVVHFELNNIIVLRYAVDSCRRFLQKVKFEVTSSKKILNLFAKLSHAYPNEHVDIFRKAHAEIFVSSSQAPQDYIDLKGWVEEKLNSESKKANH